MQLEINGKVVELNFGLKFLKNINELYIEETKANNGISVGIKSVAFKLLDFDPLVLVEIIKSSYYNSDYKPTTEEIEAFVENTDIEKLCTDFLTQLENAPVTKKQVQTVAKTIQVVMEKMTENILMTDSSLKDLDI